MADLQQNSNLDPHFADFPAVSAQPIRFDEELEDQDPPVEMPEQFAVVDQATANWLVRQITEARAYRQHVESWAQREIRRAQREEDFLLRCFGIGLETWAQHEIDKLKGRRQSVALPAGVVGFRHLGPRLAIDDDAAVVAWARTSLPAAITTIERLSKSAVNDHFEKTGEIPAAGAHVEPAAQRFFIR